ncbi:DUF4097 family beta strand repeat-containing protein [Roseivirga echinicomitans]|uniref:DUF4097 domain-containing protein n=1 Tax=Roseivirga echinicomitans TaxID=296218 RepID=A0A150XCQ7_9BACT|nr:DUF4097 family beta strand repeat-containing protein [Roseivirga echinicomitans]KYG76454.1 hypothetical protein AWN68_05310 [Roseivirga echinicomitans]
MKTLKITLLAFIALVLTTTVYSQERITKTFSGIENINLSTASGNGTIKRSNNSEVTVTVEYTFDEDIYKPIFQRNGSTLRVEEKFERSRWNRGYSRWTLEVPNGIDLNFKTGSGNIEVSGVSINVIAKSGSGNIYIKDLEGTVSSNTGSGNLDFSNIKGTHNGHTGSGNIRVDRSEGDSDMTTGSGNVRLRDVTGVFKMSSGSGNVIVEGAAIKGASLFSTGSGNVEVELSSALDYDLNLGTGSGNATLDFNGSQISGEFIMEASSKNSIQAPFSFDRTSEKGRRYVKEAKVGNKSILVKISSGSGRAVVRD